MRAANRSEAATGGAAFGYSILERYELPDRSIDEPTGAGILNPLQLMSSRVAGHSYPLWRVHYRDKPLSLLVRKDHGTWLAERDDLNILGTGTSPMKALLDAEQHVRYFAEYYSQRPDEELATYARKLKRKFSDISFPE